MLFTEKRLTHFFSLQTIKRGSKYYYDGRVQLDGPPPYLETIVATVCGSHQKIYRVEVEFEQDAGKLVDVDGYCSCPMDYNCKHVVATLLEAQAKIDAANTLPPPTLIPTESSKKISENVFNDWFREFSKDQDHLASLPRPATKPHQLVYLLETSPPHYTVQVDLALVYLLKNGRYSQPKHYSPAAESQQSHLTPMDEDILSTLQRLNKRTFSYTNPRYEISLSKPGGADAIHALLATKRCFWQEIDGAPLTLGAEKPLHLSWQLQQNAHQQLTISIDNDPSLDFLYLDHPWYLDNANHCCGPLKTSLDSPTLKKLLSIPPLPTQAANKFFDKITKLVDNLPAPTVFNNPKKKTGLIPTAQLTIKLETLKVATQSHAYYGQPTTTLIDKDFMVVSVSFDYQDLALHYPNNETSEWLSYQETGQLYLIQRNLDEEKRRLEQLSEHLPLTLAQSASPKKKPDRLIITDTEQRDPVSLSLKLSELEALGWQVLRDHPQLHEVYQDEELEWYSDLEDSSDYQYFDFKLGVLIDGEKVNLLPAIAGLIKSPDFNTLMTDPDDKAITVTVNQKILRVPVSRLKPIVSTLLELYNTELSAEGSLKLSQWQAALLHEMQLAFKASRLRWFNHERFLKLGEALTNFKTIGTVKPPSTFKAALRPYQQEGVNWLQFLREFNLSGILADDMGLGKTVQTLAHLSIEKNKRRLKLPSLIVAPTSLMLNWRQEAERFTPNLSVLTYHGPNRHNHDGTFEDYDIVLTTYPLLARDKAQLIEQPFYYLILDEAQFIKNAKAKSTQIIQQLHAENRLCLTGTPMENHLSELWSLFHFLMPGFLGNPKQFKTLFQTPIEKYNDPVRRKALAKRIQPFLVRRKKTEVAKELPPKNVITVPIELLPKERDLYESIRLSMEKKVRQAIQEKGVSRSHIIILDALLKLRQICCHSALLKLEAAKKISSESSKLERLREMLPEMIEEGRKIIIFSQFTSMLALIETMLHEQDLPYVKLTGSTTKRERPINAFQSGDVPIFLISLKAGGTGLNLTAADTVIHYDPWWNPAVEDQATDRAHRLGQNKTVFVYKLIAAGTVEESIQDMQQKKRKLVEGLFDEQAGSKLELTADSLQTLFKPLE